MKKLFLMLLIILGMAATSFAQAPGWARGQQLLSITYEDCVRRAPLALQAECYRIDHAAGNFSVGMKEVHTAVIICNPVGDGNEVVNIVIGSNADGGGSERQRLQAQMERGTPTATAPCPTLQPPPQPQPQPSPPPQPPPQSVLGTWCYGERPCYISQSGNSLTITNDAGYRSGGYLENSNTVIASDWEGGLRGKVNSDFSRIDWANGTYWVRCGSVANARVFQRVKPQVEELPEEELEWPEDEPTDDDPVPPTQKPAPGGQRWILESVTNNLHLWNCKSECNGYKSTGESSVHMYSVPDRRSLDFQWTAPPQQIDSNGFTVSMSIQISKSDRIQAVMGVSGIGINSDTPGDQQGFKVMAEDGSTASGQKSVTFKPVPNASELEVNVGFMWGPNFKYKYRRAE